jgi:type VI protein secretion system component Hcp
MSMHDEKLQQQSPAEPVSITKDGELGDEQLKEVSGGIVVTKRLDKATTKLFMDAVAAESAPIKSMT